MSSKKYNQFIKTYKMAASFKLNHADFPPLLNSAVSKPFSYVSPLLSLTTASRSFSNRVRAISFISLTKASNKPFPRVTHFVLEFLLLRIYTILPNRSHSTLLVTFQANSNVTLFVKLSCRFNPLL